MFESAVWLEEANALIGKLKSEFGREKSNKDVEIFQVPYSRTIPKSTSP